MDFASSPISLLPPLLALGLAIITRRVLLSLGAGIVIGGFLLSDNSFSGAASYIFNTVYSVFIEDGSINSWNMSIVGFLLLLGMMTALLTLSGGTRAFALWAQARVKSKRGSKLLAAFLGVFIFIDDYFNSIAVGAVARPVTDRFYVSRAKLAYILDSTAAPMCVLTPASSWGAYIMTIIGGILVSHNMTEYSALGAYVRLIPMNFYAVFALLMVFTVAWFKIDVGAMRRHEIEASQGRGFDNENSSQDAQHDDELDIEQSPNGSVLDLILPIITLIVATVLAMMYTGGLALADDGQSFTVLRAFENTDVGTSLIYGGVIGLVVALATVWRQRLPLLSVSRALWVGAKSMFGAILILLFAWSIGSVIGDMKTGAYLSSMAQQANINAGWLPVILFLLAGMMAFSTGTSWGTFGIMLPIAGDLAGATDLTLMLPMLGAVLAGSVFGDHCSPISDTTILSSTGARCNHMDHVTTQLPYAVSVALISCVGFITLGMTTSTMLSFAAASVAFVLVCLVLSMLSRTRLENQKI
ncbi:Na+/H+ antiporter NhaC family protein [Vibrio rarus]